MITRRSFLLSPGALAFPACRSRKRSGFNGYAFVANEEGRAVAVVDLAVFAVSRHVRLNGSPTTVIAHPVRPEVYALTPESGAIHRISADTLSLNGKLRVAPSAHAMRLTPDGRSLWVLASPSRFFVRVSLENWKIDRRIPLPAEADDFDLSPDGKLCAVSFRQGGKIGFLDMTALEPPRITDLGRPVGKLRFRRDGRQLLVGIREERTLSILDTATGRTVVNLPLAIEPENFCFKADGGQLFLSGEGMDAIAIVYPYQTEVAGAILAGHAPGYLAASSTPDFLFVANPKSGDVTIIDIQTKRVVAVAAVGREPGHITFTPDNQYALVLNRGSGDMAVIRISAITPRRTKSAPLFTMIPVGSRPVSAVVRAV